MIRVLQRRHARRSLGLSVHDEELAAALRRPFANLGLNAKIERSAGLREHLDGRRHEARAQAGERNIVKGNAWEMRSADGPDLRRSATIFGSNTTSTASVWPVEPEQTSS